MQTSTKQNMRYFIKWPRQKHFKIISKITKIINITFIKRKYKYNLYSYFRFIHTYVVIHIFVIIFSVFDFNL